MIEYLNYVDDRDRVLGALPKEVIHARGLTRRIVHVFLFDRQGRMAVQLRSQTVRYRPLHWVTAASGHVQAGESYHDAAVRETEEELGFRPSLRFLGTHLYSDVEAKRFLGTFIGAAADVLAPHPDDIERVAFFSLGELHRLIRMNERVHPEFAWLVRRHFLA